MLSLLLVVCLTVLLMCSESHRIQSSSWKSKSLSPLKQSLSFQKFVSIRAGSTQSMVTALIGPSVSGGLLSGGLHAISGPDHLASIIPSSIGRPAINGIQIGAIWGLGHGLSAITLGLVAFFLKGRLSGQFQVLSRLSDLAESAVGLSLLFIGVMGIYECRELAASHSSNTLNIPVDTIKNEKLTYLQRVFSIKALFLNGLVHGLSLDGAPSLAPAMAMTSWTEAIQFLVSYCVGTMIAMSIAAGGIGELSLRIGRFTDNPNLSRQLSLASSVAAVLIGLYWMIKSLLMHM